MFNHFFSSSFEFEFNLKQIYINDKRFHGIHAQCSVDVEFFEFEKKIYWKEFCVANDLKDKRRQLNVYWTLTKYSLVVLAVV